MPTFKSLSIKPPPKKKLTYLAPPEDFPLAQASLQFPYASKFAKSMIVQHYILACTQTYFLGTLLK